MLSLTQKFGSEKDESTTRDPLENRERERFYKNIPKGGMDRFQGVIFIIRNDEITYNLNNCGGYLR